jgi:hypothetical protein
MVSENKYSLKELEELLPDFVFGRLSKGENYLFEVSMQEFPEIIKEVEQVRSVFSRVEKMDFEKKISSRARNISVKVNSRLNEKNRPIVMKNWKVLLPAFSVLTIAFLYIFSPYKIFDHSNNDSRLLSEQRVLSDEFKILTPEDLNDDLYGSDSTYSQVAECIVPSFGENNNELLNHYSKTNSKLIEQVYADNLLDNAEMMEDYLMESNSNELNLLHNLDDLEENDIQNLLKEIEYEKFGA